jgi:uncharacterized membrane protein HdeD (DUF308 family)
MAAERQNDHSRSLRFAFWLALLRGFFAIMLALALIFNPEKTRVMLVNFMGFFWLTNGIILIRNTHAVFGDQTERLLGKKTSLVMGIVAILTGLMVISRSITRQYVQEVVFIELLGGIILLTGILHLISGFRVGRQIKAKHMSARKILAIFEIVLGMMLIVSPLEQGPFIYWTATIWALVGGGLIISDAFYQRAQLKREQKTGVKPTGLDDG